MTPAIHAQIRHWSALWGVPELASRVEVRTSGRLRATLARCRPAEARITLSERLEEAPAEERAEVLCHELAHVAVAELHGPAVRPHGEEWRALVRAAGFEPRVSRPGRPGSAATSPRPRLLFAHRCPVCQTVRYARAPVHRWRCAECLDAGLEGILEITSEPVL